MIFIDKPHFLFWNILDIFNPHPWLFTFLQGPIQSLERGRWPMKIKRAHFWYHSCCPHQPSLPEHFSKTIWYRSVLKACRIKWEESYLHCERKIVQPDGKEPRYKLLNGLSYIKFFSLVSGIISATSSSTTTKTSALSKTDIETAIFTKTEMNHNKI